MGDHDSRSGGGRSSTTRRARTCCWSSGRSPSWGSRTGAPTGRCSTRRDVTGSPPAPWSEAPAGAVHVTPEPDDDDETYPRGFYLRVVDGVVWLRGYRCDDAYVWGPEQRMALVQPEGGRRAAPGAAASR